MENLFRVSACRRTLGGPGVQIKTRLSRPSSYSSPPTRFLSTMTEQTSWYWPATPPRTGESCSLPQRHRLPGESHRLCVTLPGDRLRREVVSAGEGRTGNRVWSKEVHTYQFGCHFSITSDHNPLQHMFMETSAIPIYNAGRCCLEDMITKFL